MKHLLLIVMLFPVCLFSQSYTWEWVQSIGSSDWDMVNGISIVVDEYDDVYFTGYSGDTAYTAGNMINYNGAKSSFLTKYDFNGNFIWSRGFGGASDDYPESMCIDNENNVYVIGVFSDSATFDGVNWEYVASCTSKCYIVKFDVNGNLLWYTVTGNNRSHGRYIDVDEYNNLYSVVTTYALGGDYEGQTLILEVGTVLAKYDNQNNFLWLTQILELYSPKITYEKDHIYVSGRSGTGDIIIGSDTIYTDHSNQMMLFKFDSQGNYIWHKKIIGDAQAINMYSNNEHIYLVGNYADTLGLPNYTLFTSPGLIGYFAKIDSSGNTCWAHNFDSSGSQINSLDFDQNDNLWVVGFYMDYLNCGPFNLTTPDWSYFVFMTTESGVISSSNYLDWSPTCQAGFSNIRLDGYDNKILNGVFSDCFNGGSFYMDTIGKNDLFLTKLSLTTKIDDIEQKEYGLFPNPTTGKITIKAEDIESIEIINIEGREVYKGKETEIDLSSQPKGIYIIKVITDKQTITRRLIKQ